MRSKVKADRVNNAADEEKKNLTGDVALGQTNRLTFYQIFGISLSRHKEKLLFSSQMLTDD